MTVWTDDMAANGWQRVWKITHVDGTTFDSYRWPLPMDHHKPVLVKATGIDEANTGACPTRPGDGLCVVRTGIVRHVTSGGVRLTCCIGLDMRIRPKWILGSEQDEKLRVSQVQVLGLFRPLDIIRSGAINDLGGADLRDADLRGTDLRGANLREADLRGANMRDAMLRDANLGGADLRDANLRGTDLRETNLRKANMRHAMLRNADMGGADLRNADMGGADMVGAMLRDADLRVAKLRDANLRDANLRGADLRDAMLLGADLRGADLLGALASDAAAMPAGFDAAAAGVQVR